jgi:hypothetical protein
MAIEWERTLGNYRFQETLWLSQEKIVTETGIPMELVRIVKICVNGTCKGKHAQCIIEWFEKRNALSLFL